MEWFEGRPSMPRGGGSASGSFYHLSFRSCSRAGGACAGTAHAYITRTEEYDDPERDTAVYTMTPTERRQFDALMKWNALARR
jgi:hypothetical protein